MNQITIDELLMGRIKAKNLTPEQTLNMGLLLPRANALLAAFGEYRKVNSGYRSESDQDRINPGAPHSKHLMCAAVDLNDPDGKLANFCMTNLSILASLKLWIENPTKTKGWVHVQCLPPKSGSRVFNP